MFVCLCARAYFCVRVPSLRLACSPPWHAEAPPPEGSSLPSFGSPPPPCHRIAEAMGLRTFFALLVALWVPTARVASEALKPKILVRYDVGGARGSGITTNPSQSQASVAGELQYMGEERCYLWTRGSAFRTEHHGREKNPPCARSSARRTGWTFAYGSDMW